MPSVNRLAVVLLTVLLTGACDGRLPTMPTAIIPSVPGTPSPIPPWVTYRFVGFVVDGGDEPVTNANLTFSDRRSTTAVTDASGAYDVSIELRQRSATVIVSKPGYESSIHGVGLDPEMDTSRRNLRLHQIRSITAGESVHLSVNQDDPTCDYEMIWNCRRIRVRSASPSTVMLEVMPDDAGARFGLLIGPIQEPYQPKSRLSVPVTAGSEIPVDILFVRNDRGFTLKTWLGPN